MDTPFGHHRAFKSPDHRHRPRQILVLLSDRSDVVQYLLGVLAASAPHNCRKRGRRQTLRGGSVRARLNGPARVDAWRIGCRKVMADQAAGAAV